MRTLYLDCCQGVDLNTMAAALYDLLSDSGDSADCLEILKCFLPGIGFSAQEGDKLGMELSMDIHGIEGSIWKKWETMPDVKSGLFSDERSGLISDPKSGAYYDMIDIIGRMMTAYKNLWHNMPEDISFMDLISREDFAYLMGICIMMGKLAPEQVIISPLNIGNISSIENQDELWIPVTMQILKDIPLSFNTENEFLCSPLMAAILSHYVRKSDRLPIIRIQHTGYGIFTYEKDTIIKRRYMAIYLGETREDPDHIYLLHANLDDMTGEALGFAQEMIWKAGALDVYTTSIQMKKNRPATMLSCICRPEDKEACLDAFLRYTTTLGVRMESMERRILSRSYERRNTEAGEIGIKTVKYKDTRKWKAEYDDLRRIALERGIPLREAERFLDK